MVCHATRLGRQKLWLLLLQSPQFVQKPANAVFDWNRQQEQANNSRASQEQTGHKMMAGHCDNRTDPPWRGGSMTNLKLESIDTQRYFTRGPWGIRKVSSLRVWSDR